MKPIMRYFLLSLLIFGQTAVARSRTDFSIIEYDTSGDRLKVQTLAIKLPIDDYYKIGGRTVIAVGRYASAFLHLKDSVKFYVCAGTALFSSNDNADFPRISPSAYRSLKGISGWRSLIFEENTPYISVVAKGGNRLTSADTSFGEGQSMVIWHQVSKFELPDIRDIKTAK